MKNKEMTIGETCRTILRSGKDAILEISSTSTLIPSLLYSTLTT